jgi:branched-subunit amino acid aminotransferase/4-amino-4-deoxychorismate lyase
MPALYSRASAYGGEIFKLHEHTERLHESARLLGFKILIRSPKSTTPAACC